MKTRVCLKYSVSYCLWKFFIDSNSPQTTSSLIFLISLVTLRSFTLFNLKLEQLSGRKALKFALLCNSFSDPFPEVEIWYQKNFKFVLGRFLER